MAFLQVNKPILTIFVLLFACFAIGQKDDPVTISYEPVWEGLGSGLTYLPVRLTVENTGKPEIVEVKWTDGDTEISTFFDLPTGSVKQRDIYFANQNAYDTPEIRIKRGFLEVPQSIELGIPDSYSPMKVGIISDTLGLISAFKEDRKGQFENKVWAEGFGVGLAKPGAAPTRAIGYRDLRVLFLGEGSERLTDEEVFAIQNAVLAGLRVIFIGGTIQPVLNDPRWQNFLPVVPGVAVKPVSPPPTFRTFANELPGPSPMLDSQSKPGATVVRSDGVVVMANQLVGAGAVTYMAYDPFGREWKGWSGRYALLNDLCTHKVSGGWSDYLNDIDGYNYDYGYGYSSNEGPSADVFGITVPSSGRIIMVLLAYFVLVVPVNFLVLRKLKRGELAWFTAPLIALGAAGVLFAFAGKLYSAEASRYASGWFLGSDGVEQGVFIGNQQLFFPGTGRYDLGLENVESVMSTSYSDYSMFGQQQIQSRFVDFGSVVAPAYEVSNLSFREFGLQQNVAVPSGWVSMIRDERTKSYSGEIKNPFDEKLENVAVFVGGKRTSIGTIEAGKAMPISIKNAGVANSPCWIEANISGKSFGSNFGKSVGEGSVRLLYTVHPEVKS